MNNYWDNERVWLFWTGMAIIAFICVDVIMYYYFKCKKITITPDNLEDISYKIDGFCMTSEAAEAYYSKEISRGRRKNTLHLVIRDHESDTLLYDDLASIYYEKIRPIQP